MIVGICGLGLIGGSLAKALRNRCGVKTIVASNRSEDVLITAKAEGINFVCISTSSIASILMLLNSMSIVP